MSVGENIVRQTIGGEEVEFRKLTPYDRAEILRAVKTARRASLLADLKAIDADQGSMLAELRDLDAEPMKETDFIEYINTVDGKIAVIDVAMRGIAEEKRAAIRGQMNLGPSETLDLVARLCNMTVDTIPASEGDDPNPASPVTTAEPESYTQPA